MMQYKILIIFTSLLLFCALVTSTQSPTKYSFDMLPSPTFDNDTAFVNESSHWVTKSEGALDDVNTTQLESVGGSLTIV